eukprot:TRINITY_DN7338_c0_g1_i1.p1 TRINITY_DN7338_c0_g1~~TRINITY_DN7338_c0_g1_i1.p1  ORF type:complete len:607 (-),score=82.87 TRINITY_DN7338_c0_g1_i1:57-1877(-)
MSLSSSSLVPRMQGYSTLQETASINDDVDSYGNNLIDTNNFTTQSELESTSHPISNLDESQIITPHKFMTNAEDLFPKSKSCIHGGFYKILFLLVVFLGLNNLLLVLSVLFDLRVDELKIWKFTLIFDIFVCGYITVYMVLKLFLFIVSKFSSVALHYLVPFGRPLSFCVAAIVLVTTFPLIVDSKSPLPFWALRIKDVFDIIVACSITEMIKFFFVLSIETFVFGDIQGPAYSYLWIQRALISLTVVPKATGKNGDVFLKLFKVEENIGGIKQTIEALKRASPFLLDGYTASQVKVRAEEITEQIMKNVDISHKGLLDVTDLSFVLGNNAQQFIRKVRISILGETNFEKCDRITKPELVLAITKLIEQRKSLLDLLNSRRLIVDVLDQIISTIMIIVMGVLILSGFGVNIYTLLVGLGTAFLGLGFAFSTTLQGLLESLTMIFFVRPFQIGDLVRVDDGPVCRVESVNLFSTFLYSADGYGVLYPNAVLSRSKISNYRRSKFVTLTFKHYVKIEVTGEQIARLKGLVKGFLESAPSVYSRDFTLMITSTHDTYLVIELEVTIKTIWQDAKNRKKREAEITLFLLNAVQNLEIHYYPKFDLPLKCK